MSDYIIHNIGLDVTPKLDFEGLEEEGKPVTSYPNYYLGKCIGGKGKELGLKRTRDYLRQLVNEGVLEIEGKYKNRKYKIK